MISPPTDRLHKFLAIGGLVVAITSVTIPLDKYHEAEVQRINTFAKAREIQYSYQRYAAQVNKMIEINNDAVRNGVIGKERDEVAKKIHALDPEATKLSRELEALLVEGERQAGLSVHYSFLKNIWLCIGIIGFIVGIAASFFGFRQWLIQPKDVR